MADSKNYDIYIDIHKTDIQIDESTAGNRSYDKSKIQELINQANQELFEYGIIIDSMILTPHLNEAKKPSNTFNDMSNNEHDDSVLQHDDDVAGNNGLIKTTNDNKENKATVTNSINDNCLTSSPKKKNLLIIKSNSKKTPLDTDKQRSPFEDLANLTTQIKKNNKKEVENDVLDDETLEIDDKENSANGKNTIDIKNSLASSQNGIRSKINTQPNAGKVRHNVIQNIGNLEIVQSTGRLEEYRLQCIEALNNLNIAYDEDHKNYKCMVQGCKQEPDRYFRIRTHQAIEHLSVKFKDMYDSSFIKNQNKKVYKYTCKFCQKKKRKLLF